MFTVCGHEDAPPECESEYRFYRNIMIFDHTYFMNFLWMVIMHAYSQIHHQHFLPIYSYTFFFPYFHPFILS